MKTGILSIMIVAACALFFGTVPAEAALITIEIEAVVDFVEDSHNYLEGKIKVGDTITGWYTYDTSTPDSASSNPTVGRYEHHTPPCGISLTAGGFEFKTNAANVDFLVGIANNVTSGGLHDSYWIQSYNNLPLSNGVLVDDISWSLRDYSATALSSIDLPTTAPVLEDWQSGNLLRLHGVKWIYKVDAHVTSAVPEPGTILLFGLVGLLLRKRC